MSAYKKDVNVSHFFSFFDKQVNSILRKNVQRILWILMCIAIVYLEAGVYFIQKLSWPTATCGVQPSYYHKVLLVADPQILGEQGEPWLARWDCDRFLSKTFKLAMEHVQPSMVIFLGDLMDEGSIATSVEFERYYQRFRSIFLKDPTLSNKTIYLPGDNDIGGEDEEITPQTLTRYNKYFGSEPEVVPFRNVQFVKVNFMLKTVPHFVPPESDQNITVVLSHMSLLGASSFFTERIIREVKPSLIISAHDHKAVHFVGDLMTGDRTFIESMVSKQEPKWRFQTSKMHTNEILVPTCSYRMGVKDTGYGVLLIDSKGDNVCYSILWLPDRLFHISIYFFFYLPLIAFVVLIKCKKKCHL